MKRIIISVLTLFLLIAQEVIIPPEIWEGPATDGECMDMDYQLDLAEGEQE